MAEQRKKLTERQREVLNYVRCCGPVRTGGEASILAALARKGYVVRQISSTPGGTTWVVARKTEKEQ